MTKTFSVVQGFDGPEGDEASFSKQFPDIASGERKYKQLCKGRKFARVCIDYHDYANGEWMSGEWWLRASAENTQDQCGGASG